MPVRALAQNLNPRAPDWRAAAPALLAMLLAACAPMQPHRAPVEERSSVLAPPSAPPPAVTPESKPAPAEASRPGFYTVRPGDTLIRIALDQGLSWRELARWNGLDNPNLLEVGQVLRVTQPPAAIDGPRAVAPPPKAETRPLEPVKASAGAGAVTSSNPPAPAAQGVPAPTPPSAAVAPSGAASSEGEPNWAWPAGGSVSAPFDESRNVKGLSIAGAAGDPVLAAADGRVMYAGSGLRGYGNMVIIKHNDTYLTAYAHNRALLVKEDQVVRRGQPIAEMGSSESDQVKLHFEIRRKGKPVDPVRLLPPR